MGPPVPLKFRLRLSTISRLPKGINLLCIRMRIELWVSMSGRGSNSRGSTQTNMDMRGKLPQFVRVSRVTRAAGWVAADLPRDDSMVESA